MKKHFYVGFFILFIVAIWVLNSWNPFQSDDWAYGIQWLVPGDTKPHLGSIRVAIREQVADWYRPAAHIVFRVFCGVAPKWVFNVANALMAGVFVLLMCRVAKKRWNFAGETLVASMFFSYVFLFKGESYLWCVGSVDYLWVGVATLTFLIVRELVEDDKISIGKTLALLVPTLYFGWLQEAQTLPVAFAICGYYAFHIKKLNMQKVLIYGAYGIGVLLLLFSAIGRTAKMEPFSATVAVKHAIYICGAAKLFLILLVLLAIYKKRKEFVTENAFEFLIIIGSFGMILVAGFTGERCLWACNMVSLILILRIIKVNAKIAAIMGLVLSLILIMTCHYSHLSYERAVECEQVYLKSTDGVTYHDRTKAGIFTRYLFLYVCNWQQAGHTVHHRRYLGGTNPYVALNRYMYDNLYKEDNVCVPKNRLKIEGEYYTTADCNAIVLPLGHDDFDCSEKVAIVKYSEKQGVVPWIRAQIERRLNPSVPSDELCYCLHTVHGNYLLIPKRMSADGDLRSISFQDKN